MKQHQKDISRLAAFLSILFLTMIMLRTVFAEKQTLRSVFNPPDCLRACWLGIEPGITTQAQVQSILLSLGMAYQVKDELGVGANPANNPYGWLPSNTLPFIDNANGQAEVRIYFDQGAAQAIQIPVNIPTQMILNEYGSSYQVRVTENDLFELIYPDSGMDFYVSKRTGIGHATILVLFSPTATYYVEPPNSPVLLTTCSLFDSQCSIATATATPSRGLSPTATMQINASTDDVRTLRNLLSYPGCERTCFMGIEPGKTTLQEVKDFFAVHHVVYKVSRGIGETDDNNARFDWYLDTTLPFPSLPDPYPSSITFENGIVSSVQLARDVPLTTVISTYGSPQRLFGITTSQDYDLAYPQIGLSFYVSADFAADKAVRIYIMTNAFYERAIDGGSSVNGCTNVPSAICSIATVTATGRNDANR
jgi:hypothetical protein